MITSTQYSIDPLRIPEFSDSSKNIFKDLDIELPQVFQTAAPLKGRICSLQEAEKMLQEAKKRSVYNKMFAFLQAAVVIALLAVFVLFLLKGFGPFTVLPAFGYLFFSVYVFSRSLEKIQEIENKGPNPKRWDLAFSGGYGYNPLCLLIPVAAVIAPIYEIFTRESRLKEVIESQRASIDQTLLSYKGESAFYKDHSSELENALLSKIDQLKTCLAAMEQLPERSSSGEEDLNARIATHEQAREELSSVVEFYQQFR